MPKVDPAIAAAQATVRLDDHTDWTARKVASYTRVLENALTKIKKEVQVASYSNTSISSVSFRQLFNAPEPASKWEWDPKTEQELTLRMKTGYALAQQPRKKGYADASGRRKGFHLQPRRPSPVKEGPVVGSVFRNYLQNATLRRNVLVTGANPVVRPHYATVLQQHASIVKPASDGSVEVPSLAVLSARAFGRAIVMARDPEDLQGDYSWYSYCDESSNMYNLLAETLRGHITQLLCDAMKEGWFPQDLASTMIAQSGNAGDHILAETLFHAAYHGTFNDNNRSIARRKGELAPDPFSSILYMPDVLFRQIGHAIDERPEMMLDAWFLDVMFAGIGEIGEHVELPKLITGCLEQLLGIEVWEAGVRRQRLNRSGKIMRKKFESFDKAWLFQSKEAIQSKAADVAQDLVERLFEVGWGELDVKEETKSMARGVMHILADHMILWAKAFNHPHKEASEGSSITARTLALCAVLLSHEEERLLPAKEVTEELVRLLLVTMIEASEDDKESQTGNEAATDTFDLPDMANYVAGVVSRIYSSPMQRQDFVEGLLKLAIGDAKPDFTQTPAVGDKLKLQQKRQNYLVAIFAYHLATSLAESSKSEAAHIFAAGVEHRLVGLRISKKGLLKASDLKTPKFSNLIRDLAQTEARNNRWVYEPMLNEWVEVPVKSDETSSEDSTAEGSKRVSRKLNFSQYKSAKTKIAETPSAKNRRKSATVIEPDSSDSSDSDSHSDGEDTTVYPSSADTTMTEVDTESESQELCLPNILVEVCIQSSKKPSSSPAVPFVGSSNNENKISNMFRQSKRTRTGEFKKPAASDDRQILEKDTAVAPRKRGRPRKDSIQVRNVAAAQSVPEHDSAYEPDCDDDEEKQPQRKKRRLLLSRMHEGSGKAHDDDMDIYQDELDLISTITVHTGKVGRPRKISVSGIFKDTNKSKLNEKSNRRKSEKGVDEFEGGVSVGGRRGRRSL
ncbi:hypothetical protein H072_4169 [Dactylellina haptotyla CBS 200.50]|uniref:Uncharacterized protein n=1 Tax=Dactylellina haptotyla (strain CBS 200.50) TaxID=1284197 RepID=S8AFS0_DACHA|nr:hypothetical protein H072_4169 [Dactylellina haptotyla CBS 200.50]